MNGKSSFPWHKFDRRPHAHIMKQILEDSELIDIRKQFLIQEGKAYPFFTEK
jgi:patatin-like phospholipase/acyl hydrolase